MFSRRTTKTLASLYRYVFTKTTRVSYRSNQVLEEVAKDKLYDFLFIHDFPEWFIRDSQMLTGTRGIEEFIMGLHTGTTINRRRIDIDEATVEAITPELLRRLAEAMLLHVYTESSPVDLFIRSKSSYMLDQAKMLQAALELDGYNYNEGKLVQSEATVFDTGAAERALHQLIAAQELANLDVMEHCLSQSEQNYVEGRWDDSIAQSRKFLEAVMQEVAAKMYFTRNSIAIPASIYDKPIEVRKYFVEERLLEDKEAKAVAEVYGLLSKQGNHPHLAEKDQARLARHLMLTLAEFVLLNYQNWSVVTPTDGEKRAG